MWHTGAEAQGYLVTEAHEKNSRVPRLERWEGQRMLQVGSSVLGLQELGLGKVGTEVISQVPPCQQVWGIFATV